MRLCFYLSFIFCVSGTLPVHATELPPEATPSNTQETLTISWIHDNVNERYLIAEIEREFAKKAPHITLESVGVHTDRYKQKVRQWLANKDGPDVLYWYGNTPLKDLVQQGYVSDIEDLWVEAHLDNAFEPSILSQVRLDGRSYAVPVSYYPWSFYYNQTLFTKLNLSTPSTWEEFLSVCETLKRNNIVPIAAGYDAPWVLTSWFEFINLRLNGERFHQALLNGDIPYTHPSVKQVFSYWKVLIDKEYFLGAGESMSWDDPMPFLYRELTGMALLGHFLSARIPAGVRDEIKVFPFPMMPFSAQRIELAPLDVFFIRASSDKQKAAREFLSFMASYTGQSVFNKHAGGFSPLVNAVPHTGYFNEAGMALLQTADGTTAYFDRTVPNAFGNEAMALFKHFMEQPDVDSLTLKLEALRLKYLKPKQLD